MQPDSRDSFASPQEALQKNLRARQMREMPTRIEPLKSGRERLKFSHHSGTRLIAATKYIDPWEQMCATKKFCSGKRM